MGQGLLFSSCVLGQPALMPQGCIFLCFLNKTELWHEAITLVCLRKLHGAITLVHLSLQIFVATRQNRGNDTLPQHFYTIFWSPMDLTWPVTQTLNGTRLLCRLRLFHLPSHIAAYTQKTAVVNHWFHYFLVRWNLWQIP